MLQRHGKLNLEYGQNKFYRKIGNERGNSYQKMKRSPVERHT